MPVDVMKKTTKKLYPLTSEQMLVQRMEQFDFKGDSANICSMIHFDSEIDLKILLQAIYMAVLRCCSANVRLCKKDKTVMQYFSDQAPQSIQVLDYSDCTEEQLEADLEKWNVSRFPNKGIDSQLYEIRVVKKPNGFYGVFFHVSHYIMDGYAVMKLQSDVIELYGLLRDGKPLPPVRGDYLKLCKEMWDYEGSAAEAADLEFMRTGILGTEPSFTPVCPEKLKRSKKNKSGKVFTTNSNGFRVVLPIEKELMDKINEASAASGVSFAAYMNLATYSSLSKINNNQSDIIFMSMISRRGSLFKKSSYGSLATALPLRINMDVEKTTVAEGLRNTASALFKNYRHSGIALLEMIRCMKSTYGLSPVTEGYWTLASTIMPGFPVLPEGLKLHVQVFGNSSIPFPMYLFACQTDDSGALTCIYECRRKQTNPETPHIFHAHLVKALEAMATNPDMTMRELNAL